MKVIVRPELLSVVTGDNNFVSIGYVFEKSSDLCIDESNPRIIGIENASWRVSAFFNKSFFSWMYGMFYIGISSDRFQVIRPVSVRRVRIHKVDPQKVWVRLFRNPLDRFINGISISVCRSVPSLFPLFLPP